MAPFGIKNVNKTNVVIVSNVYIANCIFLAHIIVFISSFF